jgi:DNA-binding MarR family transcriptional regulator
MSSETISNCLPQECPVDALGDFTPEIRAMMGVHILFWKIEDLVETINIDPPLTKQERHALLRLDAPQRMGVLAKEMAALPSAITAMADALEARGLLVRERDPDDRRAWRLRLTAAGTQARTELIQKASKVFKDVSGLTDTEVEAFAELSWKIHEHILRSGVPLSMAKENL